MIPRISIITPSYNQVRFIGQTLGSVLSQNYPCLEFIVIDGGSTDGSVDVVRRYAPSLTYWISEKDNGQTDALQKGFARSSGEIVGWLNSDDILYEGALSRIGSAYSQNPGAIIAGNVAVLDASGRRQRIIRQNNLNLHDVIACWTRKATYSQPGVFFPRTAYLEAGGLDTALHYCMDRDLMIRMLRTCKVVYLDEVVAGARLHPTSKTCSQAGPMIAEAYEVSRRYWSELRYGSITCRVSSIAGLGMCAIGRVYHKDPGALLPVFRQMRRLALAKS